MAKRQHPGPQVGRLTTRRGTSPAGPRNSRRPRCAEVAGQASLAEPTSRRSVGKGQSVVERGDAERDRTARAAARAASRRVAARGESPVQGVWADPEVAGEGGQIEFGGLVEDSRRPGQRSIWGWSGWGSVGGEQRVAKAMSKQLCPTRQRPRHEFCRNAGQSPLDARAGPTRASGCREHGIIRRGRASRVNERGNVTGIAAADLHGANSAIEQSEGDAPVVSRSTRDVTSTAGRPMIVERRWTGARTRRGTGRDGAGRHDGSGRSPGVTRRCRWRKAGRCRRGTATSAAGTGQFSAPYSPL